MPKPGPRDGKAKSSPLARYRDKRRASATPEPFGGSPPKGGGSPPKGAGSPPKGAGSPPKGASSPPKGAASPSKLFVVQQHRARALHFDLRLEHDGVLKSWAVPKGPSADPADKRFARLVEDHPVEYADFEGRIPDGNYGAGWVIVWDRGTYRPLADVAEGLETGKLLFELDGFKLHGRWTLIRMKNPADWLLIKEQDALARGEPAPYPAHSVLSGLDLEQLPRRNAIAQRFANRVARQGGAVRRPVESPPQPMLATADEAFDRAGWVFELKYDGYRLLAQRDGDRVALWTRNGLQLNSAFPDIVHALASLPCPDLLLDGELVVSDPSGRPSFSLLQQRAAVAGRAAADFARHLPATYYAFDLLSAAGRDLRPLPLVNRKKLLAEVLPSSGTLRFSEHVARYGRRTLEAARELGVEGVVGKRADSAYRGGRSKDWIKVRLRTSGDFVIVGWAPSRSNSRDLGALALGEYRSGTLCFTGRVGSGLKDADRRALQQRLTDDPPGAALTDDAAVRWLAPRHVCEVAFREYTSEGHLRQPVFVRLRDDKTPAECVGHFDEPPAPPAAVERPKVTVTNPDKVFFPELSLSKNDLVQYYDRIAPWMLPYLEDRPLVLTRFPDGIHGKRFYQRDAPDFVPDWIERHVLWSEGAERQVSYFVANDAATLTYLANLGTIPIHMWHSRTSDLEHPDWCVLDLDPKGAPFAWVIRVALAARDLAGEIGLPAFPKTSGASGLHVLIPLGRQLTHDQSRTLGELLATLLVARLPEIATVARAVRSRDNKVYVDYLQNGHGKLLVAPFSARAEPAASVSMPIAWHEVNGRLRNERFTLKNALQRMRRLDADPMLEVLTLQPDLQRALTALLALTDTG